MTSVTGNQTLVGPGGMFTIAAAPVKVGTSTYHATLPTQTVTIASGASAAVTVDYSTIIPNTTKTLDSAGMNSLTVSADGTTITMSSSSPVAASLAVGDVLASAPTTAAANGLLVKITSVSTSGTTVNASVQQATLEDAIQQATFQYTTTLGPGNTTSNMAQKGPTAFASRLARPADSSTGVCAGNANTFTEPFSVPLAQSGGSSLTLTGEEDLCPSFNFALQINNFKLIYLNATTTLGSHLQIGALATWQGSFSYSQNLGSITATPTVVLIGTVPVTIQPTLTPFVGVSGSASASAYAGATEDAAYTFGSNYANGTWTVINTVTSPAAVQPLASVDGQASLKAYAGMQAGVLLDGIVAPYLSSDGYLQFISGLGGNPCWNLNAGLEASVGVKFKILGYESDYPSTPLSLYSTPLAQSTSTCFAPVLNTVSPSSAQIGGPQLTLALAGSNFVPDSVVNFNGQALTTSFVAPSDLTAILPVSDLVAGGSFPVTVTSPDNPGGTSASVPFTVSQSAVTVSPATISIPANATQQFTATVQGTTSSAVNWSVNGISGGNALVGTITPEALYTAPAAIPNPATVSITATSQAYPTASASASVTVITGSYKFISLMYPGAARPLHVASITAVR